MGVHRHETEYPRYISCAAKQRSGRDELAMERQFWAYYLPSQKVIDEFWASGFFTFDTSVLLDLYQYSPEVRGEFFGILQGIPDRIWLSNQAALEYHRGRVSVISDQQKRVADVIQALSGVKSQIKAAVQGRAGMQELDQALTGTETVLKRFREQQSAVGMKDAHAGEDQIQLSLNQVFADERSLGAPYPDDRLRELYDEGRTRFQGHVPPGYRDAETKPEPLRYGDLILWQQVLDEATSRNAPVVLVINDSKDDWWRLNGTTPFAPRAELREEIRRVANVDCWFYRLDQFLRLAKQHLQADVSDETIKEVQIVEESNAAQDETSHFEQWFQSYVAARPDLYKPFLVDPDHLSPLMRRFVRDVERRRYELSPHGTELLELWVPNPIPEPPNGENKTDADHDPES